MDVLELVTVGKGDPLDLLLNILIYFCFKSVHIGLVDLMLG